MNVLMITSSLNGDASTSTKIARDIADAVTTPTVDAKILERDVNTLPHITGESVAAALTPAGERTAGQVEAARLADTLIEEVEAADVIVIAAPMYNFSIPSTLKAWIDHIARAGRTFAYTAEGPKGLLGGRKVFVASARGGAYTSGPAKAMDFHETYLRGVLGFVGLNDVTFIHAENLARGADAAADAVAAARAEIAALPSPALAA